MQDLYLRDLHDDNEEVSDLMSDIGNQYQYMSTGIQVEPKPVKNNSTQSEQISTKNVGTMHEPVRTSSVAAGPGKQSLSTQTSDSFEQVESLSHHSQCSLLAKNDNQYRTSFRNHSDREYSIDYFSPPHNLPLRSTRYPSSMSSEHHSRQVMKKQYDPLYTSKYGTSASPPNHSLSEKNSRKSKTSKETDTSLDNPKSSQHQDFLSEPKSIRENEITSSLQTISPAKNKLSPSSYATSLGSKYSRSHLPLSTVDDNQQKEFISEPISNETKQQTNLNSSIEVSIKNHTEKLPCIDNTEWLSQICTQPHTISPSLSQHYKPSFDHRHDHSSSGDKNIKLTPQRAQQNLISSTSTYSPILNIGTQNVIYQSPDKEFATPFEEHYVDEPEYDFIFDNDPICSSTLKRGDLRSRNKTTLLLPVINSSRTYVLERQSLQSKHVRQSRTNGNFYLATSPAFRSLDSPFQDSDLGIHPLSETNQSTS